MLLRLALLVLAWPHGAVCGDGGGCSASDETCQADAGRRRRRGRAAVDDVPRAARGRAAPAGQAGAAAGEAAGGPADVPDVPAAPAAPEIFSCVRWRQTAGCSPKGQREKSGDKACGEEIPTGKSGFCECRADGNASRKVHARQVTCDHRPLTCASVCLEAERYTCKGWRQTGGCSSDGPREPRHDKGCDVEISARSSGYCECGSGRVVRKPGCEHGEFLEPFTCRDECGAEEDLYEELGVDAGASDRAIKQAYRKLSLKYHPDKTQNDPAMTARFKAIQQASEIIGDPAQRAIYDAAGLSMVYEAAKSGKAAEKGPDSTLEVKMSLESLFIGGEVPHATKRKVICRGCRQKNTARCRKCSLKCADETKLVDVQMGPFKTKKQKKVPSKEKCRMQKSTLEITVEPGMMQGDRVVFKNMGEVQPKKVPGDFVVTIKEERHPVFKRSGADLHAEIGISLEEALLGFEAELKHLDGRTLTLGFAGVTAPFSIMKVKGEGMPHRGDPTERGDLFVKCKVVMPEDGVTWVRQVAARIGA